MADSRAQLDGYEERSAFVPSSITSTNAYAELSWSLRQKIVSGALKGGDLLPPEAELAATWKVSRSTVREAVRTLQEAGLVGRSGHRHRVLAPSTDAGSRFTELRRAMRRRKVSFAGLCEALLALEPPLARLAATRASEDDLRSLMQILHAQERHSEDVETWSALDEQFHNAIAKAAKNPALLVARIPLGQLAYPALQTYLSERPTMAHAVDFHRRIFAEIVRRDGAGAENMARQHVEDFRSAWVAAGLSVSAEIGEVVPVRPGSRSPARS